MVVKVNGENELFDKAFEIFMEEYKKSVENSGTFSVAFSGGTTPEGLFKRLVKGDINWKNVNLFMVDERYLPPDHPDSNYKLLWDNLLSKVKIPPSNVRSIKHMGSLEESRLEYGKEVEEFIEGKEYSFDFIILGMGNDGHTASLFADNFKMDGNVVPSLESDLHKYNRISLGLKVINRCRKKLFLLKKDKKDILENVLKGGECPASNVNGDIIYLIEKI